MDVDRRNLTLAVLVGLEEGEWIALALCFCRVAPLVFLVPWLAPPRTTLMVRIGIAAALLAITAPLAITSVEPGVSDAMSIALAAVRELALGATFGIAVALPIHAFAWSGALVDRYRGDSASVLAELSSLLGVALFFAVGGHRLAIVAFAHSLQIAPLGRLGEIDDLASVTLGAARLIASALAFAATLAAPAAAATVMTELAVGLGTRRAPAALEGGVSPLRAGAVLLVFALTLGVAVDLMPEAFRESIGAAERIVAPE